MNADLHHLLGAPLTVQSLQYFSAKNIEITTNAIVRAVHRVTKVKIKKPAVENVRNLMMQTYSLQGGARQLTPEQLTHEAVTIGVQIVITNLHAFHAYTNVLNSNQVLAYPKFSD